MRAMTNKITDIIQQSTNRTTFLKNVLLGNPNNLLTCANKFPVDLTFLTMNF